MKNLTQTITCGILFFFLAGVFSPALAISIPEEKKLGEKFMSQIRAQGRLVEDPLTVKLIRTLGHEITQKLPPQPFDFHFYLIKNDTFNAFAAPGANIFIHTGLIAALNSTDELAGILAHEIGHAAGRHVSQSIDRAKIANIGSLAGILVGVLVGTSGDGDAGQALTMGSMAAAQSHMLAFTRENETEADQKAVQYLEGSCYSPQGLLSSLSELRAADFQGVEGIPDYFKTHPGTGERIAHLSALLADKEHTPALAACPATPDFELIKYRNLALYGKIKEGRQQLEHRLTQNPKNPAILYGLGLAWARVNRRAKAIDYFNHALDLAPQNPAIQVELGRVLAIDGQSTTAQKILTPLTRDPLLGPQARFYLGLALMDAGDIPGAQSHFTALAKGHGKQFPKSYFYLARLAAQEKRQDLSHYYLGIFYQETKDNKNALRHLKKALDTLKDPVKKEDAKKRLEAIKPGKPHKRP